MGTLTSDNVYLGNAWTTTANDTAWQDFRVSISDYLASGTISASPPKPKTNLDWLDERVNEMRVKLA